MTQQAAQEIVAGTIVEFFEAKEVLCGVCMSVKNHRLSVLTEQNREISLAQSRGIHFSSHPVDLDMGRDRLVQKLAAVTAQRRALMQAVNLEELWSLMEGEADGFEAFELAGFMFPSPVSDDHVAATQRVLLQDRLFFQYKDGRFFPRTAEKVEQRRIEMEREAEREAQLEKGSEWLQALWHRKTRVAAPAQQDAIVDSLKSYCLFGQDSPEALFVKELFKRANIPPQPQSAFRLLVRMGVWHENENLFLHEENISPDFPAEVSEYAKRLADAPMVFGDTAAGRRDLRHLKAFTIDSALTRDYDDALSLETLEDGTHEVGIHIADAAEFIARDDLLDLEAQVRVSSIYLPDGHISMLPSALSEGACSLRAGEDRLCVSFLIRISEDGRIHSSEIVPSIVRVDRQRTYQEVNESFPLDRELQVLHALAVKLRDKRLADGAVMLPLPDIQVYVNPSGMIQVNRYEKETPSQITVSEWMIAANAMAASYLAEKEIPAIFRAQGECKQETDFTQSEHELFGIYRKRRLFARAEVDARPQVHCSLALPQYTTVTSPIRRYSDLVVQRQLKHALAANAPLYSEEELRQIITRLGTVQSKIFLIQRKWTRYWILKYMEQEDIHSLNVLVLEENERYAHLLLPDFLIETNMPVPEKTRLQSGEMLRVKIERLNPREDILRLQLPEYGK
ncbi:MAG: ribonuclease catalytic domain-containing protein [Syntrophobacteraceae bacterium]|nr:ribonuclease catalytic domain-containing protein [Desulfobacteraceae bacterium]